MGKSGYLPNISGDFIYYKNLAVNGLQELNYNKAAAGLYNLNRCLGDEYLVTISNQLYEEKIRSETVYQCNHCTIMKDKIIDEGGEDEKTIQVEVKREIPINEIKIFDLLNVLTVQVLTQSKSTKVWYCSYCKNLNYMADTVQRIPEREKPYSLKVVPENPVRLKGLGKGSVFNQEFENWFYNFLEEITNQEVAYRVEWKSQNNGMEMEDPSYKDKGDRN